MLIFARLDKYNLHSTLCHQPLGLATPISSLGVVGNRESLKGMGLKGPREAAQRVDDRELSAAGGGSIAEGGAGSDRRHVEVCVRG